MLNPLIHLGIGMDFGIDRLIEMIEQRIGRLAANAVLYVLTFAVLAWGIKTVGSFAVSVISYGNALWLFFRGAKAPQFTASDAILVSINVALFGVLLVLYFAGLAVIQRRTRRKLTLLVDEAKADALAALAESQKEADAILLRTRDMVTACQAFTESNHTKLHEAADDVQRLLDQLEAQTQTDAPTTSPRHPDGESDNQSPQGTEPEKPQ